MDGIHDMGGMQGFGSVAIDPDEPVFREEWHSRAFAMGVMSMGVSGTNLDAFRHALERLHPYDYLADGYYGRWLACAELLLTDSGVLAPGAVEARARKLMGEQADEPNDPEPDKPVFERGGPGSLREIDDPPAFSSGDRVRAKDLRTGGHTRLPGYVRGRAGVVTALRPSALLPDTNAHFQGENPQHVYTVEFDSTELWGDGAEPAALRIDLFESYLEAA